MRNSQLGLSLSGLMVGAVIFIVLAALGVGAVKKVMK